MAKSAFVDEQMTTLGSGSAVAQMVVAEVIPSAIRSHACNTLNYVYLQVESIYGIQAKAWITYTLYVPPYTLCTKS